MPEERYSCMEDCVKKNPNRKDAKEYCDKQLRKVEGKTYTFQTDTISYSTEQVEIEGKSEEKYYVTGYISTNTVDLYNDLVTRECLEDMLNQIKGKNIKIDVEHEAFRISPNIIPMGKIIEGFVDTKGLWVKAEINSANPAFEAIWKSIKNKFIDAFSITYQVIDKAEKQIGEKTIRLLNKINLLNVALTGNPVNEMCKIQTVFAKSIQDSEIKDMGDKMAETEKEPEQKVEEVKAPEVKTEPIPIPVEDKSKEKIEQMEKEIAELKSKLNEDRMSKLEAEIVELKNKPQMKALLEPPVVKPIEKVDILSKI